MLTGNTYLFGRNIEQIKSLCCSPRSTDILKDLPHPIQEILERCLALPPHQRFNHWEELETSLETAYSTLMKHKIPGEDKFGLKGDGQEINLINSFYALAFQYIHIGKYGEARSKIKTAIIKSRKLKLRTPEIIGELYLGDLATYQGNYDQANANYTKALSYFRRKEDVHGITLSLRRLGAAYTSQGDYDKAIDYIKQAIDLSAEQIDIVGSMKDLQDLGTLLKYKGETTSAIQCYEKSLKIAKSIGNKSGEANAIMFLGIIHKNQGNFYKALDFHSTALKIFLEIGFRSGEMEALTNLGVTYKNIGENYKAVECYEDALSISQELGEKRTEGGILFNLGRIYFILREFDLSLTYMNEALNISTAIGNKHLEASTTGCIGNLHSIQGNYRSAKLAYEKAIQIAQETGDIGVVADNCFDLAILLANLREFTEAEYNAELAAQIWLKTNNFRYQQAIHFIKEIQRYY